jgi:hypothetical protein
MKSKLILLIVFHFIIAIVSGQPQKKDYLVKVVKGEFDEIGAGTGYVNMVGDTVIPIGKYHYCYTDTLKYFAIVLTKQSKCVAIDRNEKELFEVFWLDNGPDNVSEGFFRIKKNGKIGYSNLKGKIVVEPEFECAFPFKNGKAKVSIDCKTISDGEYHRWKSDDWLYIDKEGKRIKN